MSSSSSSSMTTSTSSSSRVVARAAEAKIPAAVDPKSPAGKLKLEKLLTEANLLRSRNKFQDAINTYDMVLSLDPNNIGALNAQGTSLKSLGDNVRAMECYQKVLALDPANWRAHNNMGLIYKDTGLFQEALEEYKLAIQHGPSDCQAKENLAVVLTDLGTRLKMAGSIETAITRYKEATKYNPNYAPAYFNLGVICSESGRFVDALRYYNTAVERNAKYVEALCNIGVIYKNSGQLELAIQFYEKALAVNPNFVIANNNLAIAYTDMGTKVKNEGNVPGGVKFYKQALVFNSKYPAAWYNLGVAYAEQSRCDEAIVCYEMAVNFNPKCAKAYNNLGVIYKDKEKPADAPTRPLLLNSTLLALNNLGIIYKDRGNLDKSLFYYEEALKANPKFSQTLNNMGVIYTMLGKLDEAYLYCQKAIQANPRYAEAYNNLGVLYRDEGKIAEAIASYDRCLKLDPTSRNAGQNRLLAMNSLADEAPEDSAVTHKIASEHKAWGARFVKMYDRYELHDNKRNTDRPLRIGYLSADFFTHSVSYFIEAALANANKQRTFVTCYSNVVRNDRKTEHLQKLSHSWRTVFGLGSKEVAEQIRKDKIDILVELTGHTAGNRLDVMAHKPAPIQVTWIGYPNTTGLPTVDYRFTDDIVDPVDTKQEYVEELIRLPGPFLCYTPPPDAPDVSPLPAATNGFITFGSFNNLAKVNDRVLHVWCAILKRVPESRILIKCKPFACPSVRKKVLDRFELEGVEPKRVDLIPLLPTTHEHLQSYSMIDISVDTFPYAGTTTTCEALYCGVPVVTLQRTKFPNHAHNVGSTLLSRIKGMKSFIASTEDDYVRLAVAAASDIPRLVELRKTLRPTMLASPLCDGKTFCKQLEDTYQKVWKRFVTAHPNPAVPVPVTVSTPQNWPPSPPLSASPPPNATLLLLSGQNTNGPPMPVALTATAATGTGAGGAGGSSGATGAVASANNTPINNSTGPSSNAGGASGSVSSSPVVTSAPNASSSILQGHLPALMTDQKSKG